MDKSILKAVFAGDLAGSTPKVDALDGSEKAWAPKADSQVDLPQT